MLSWRILKVLLEGELGGLDGGGMEGLLSGGEVVLGEGDERWGEVLGGVLGEGGEGGGGCGWLMQAGQ